MCCKFLQLNEPQQQRFSAVPVESVLYVSDSVVMHYRFSVDLLPIAVTGSGVNCICVRNRRSNSIARSSCIMLILFTAFIIVIVV